MVLQANSETLLILRRGRHSKPRIILFKDWRILKKHFSAVSRGKMVWLSWNQQKQLGGQWMRKEEHIRRGRYGKGCWIAVSSELKHFLKRRGEGSSDSGGTQSITCLVKQKHERSQSSLSDVKKVNRYQKRLTNWSVERRFSEPERVQLLGVVIWCWGGLFWWLLFSHLCCCNISPIFLLVTTIKTHKFTKLDFVVIVTLVSYGFLFWAACMRERKRSTETDTGIQTETEKQRQKDKEIFPENTCHTENSIINSVRS